ncbi:MAG TPA: hypothetical protein VLD84_04115 [Nitrososphaeraceae archaeon]|nr:hypothetical protein [Nitrososphaeraceae archaeon]
MKVLYSIPVVLVVIIISSLLMFSSTGYERAYGQQEQTQNDPVNIEQEIETNLTLGKPL